METVLLQNFLNGVSYGLVLFIIASGLSLTLGIMGYFNLAHGALYMLGAYVGLTIVELGYNFWLAAILTGIVIGLLGLVLEWIFLRRLYRQVNEQVVLTIGFVYILTNIVLWVWGGSARLSNTPSSLAGSVTILSFSFPIYRLALIFVGLVVALGLWWLQEKTRFGAIVRSTMDDREMTMGLGISYGLICSAVFFLGTFLAGFAGLIGAPIMGAQSGMAIPILLMAMIAVVVGGVGSIQGTLIGAIAIGLVDSFGRSFFPNLAMFYVFAAFIVILLVKPSGLLGRKMQ
jgi:branched-chain amino acid transport system permease protein